jgi:hypothetical protein
MGIEPMTFSVLRRCDNHYTKATVTIPTCIGHLVAREWTEN